MHATLTLALFALAAACGSWLAYPLSLVAFACVVLTTRPQDLRRPRLAR